MTKFVIFSYAVIFGLLMACQAPVTSSSGLAPSEPGQASSTTRNPVLSTTRQASSFPLAAASASPQKSESPSSAEEETRSLVTEASPKPNTSATVAPSPTPTPEPTPEPTPAPTATPAYRPQLQLSEAQNFDFRISQKIDTSWAQNTGYGFHTEIETDTAYSLQINPEDTDYRVSSVPGSMNVKGYYVAGGERRLILENQGNEITSPLDFPTNLPPLPMINLESLRLEATVSATGEIHANKDLESLWENFISSYPPELQKSLTQTQNKSELLNTFKTRLESHFQTFFGMYPQIEVNQGDTWNARQPLSFLLIGEEPGGARLTSRGTPRWRLERIGEKVELSYQGNLSLHISGQSDAISAREVATVILDSQTGLLESLDFTIEVNLQRNHPHTPIKIQIQRL